MTIAVYLRLSESDGDLGKDGKDESNSIENQRELIYTYIDARNLEGKIVEYIDDGYSGTNFNRPGFKRMIEDAKKGLVDTVIVKDLSRLGRDYVIAGDYIEQIFPMLNVRFIAVNNSYDSLKCKDNTMSFDVAVGNLVNTFYSRDLSRKMKAANKVRWQQGISTASHAPFGYDKSPTEKGKYVIDPVAGKIVRFIFDKAIAGNNTTEIAILLNKEGYPTPFIYQKYVKNWNMAEPITAEKERLWDCGKVLSILQREEYTGTLIMGKSRSLTVGANTGKALPRSEWIIVENVNEPIVSAEEFEEANMVVKSKQHHFFIDQKYPLKGKVRCGNCNQCLQYEVTTYKEVFLCRHGRHLKKQSKCCKDDYSVKHIESVVWHTIVNTISTLKQLGVKVESQTNQQINELKVNQKQLEKEISNLKAEKIRQYEFYAEGKISKDGYLKKREELSCLQEEKEKLLSEEENDLSLNRELLKTASDTNELVKQFSDSKKLDRKIVLAFIDTVYVYDPNTIKVVFIQEDTIKQFCEYLDEFEKTS